MMLNRTGPVVRVPLIKSPVQIGEGQQAPWVWRAGAPYLGTASPPPPPVCMYVCVCVCVCVCGRVGGCMCVSSALWEMVPPVGA